MITRFGSILLATSLLALSVSAQSTQPDAALAPVPTPTTAPAATTPATAPTTAPVDPQVRALLDQVRDAYGNLKSAQFSGTISFNFEAGGEDKSFTDSFTSSFVAPARFRHEIKNDL